MASSTSTDLFGHQPAAPRRPIARMPTPAVAPRAAPAAREDRTRLPAWFPVCGRCGGPVTSFSVAVEPGKPDAEYSVTCHGETRTMFLMHGELDAAIGRSPWEQAA